MALARPLTPAPPAPRLKSIHQSDSLGEHTRPRNASALLRASVAQLSLLIAPTERYRRRPRSGGAIHLGRRSQAALGLARGKSRPGQSDGSRPIGHFTCESARRGAGEGRPAGPAGRERALRYALAALSPPSRRSGRSESTASGRRTRERGPAGGEVWPDVDVSQKRDGDKPAIFVTWP